MHTSEKLGYEQKRQELCKFVKKNYVDAFDLKPCTMLDAGCGDGFWSEIFNDLGFSVTGVDISPFEIGAAIALRPDSIDFHVGNVMEEMPFDSKQFDLVFARTLPMFHEADLTRANRLIDNLRQYGNYLLFSIYNRPDLGMQGHLYHYIKDDYVYLLDSHNKIDRVKEHNHYLQIGFRCDT